MARRAEQQEICDEEVRMRGRHCRANPRVFLQSDIITPHTQRLSSFTMSHLQQNSRRGPISWPAQTEPRRCRRRRSRSAPAQQEAAGRASRAGGASVAEEAVGGERGGGPRRGRAGPSWSWHRVASRRLGECPGGVGGWGRLML